MKTFIINILFTFVIITSVLVLGIFIPLIISLFLSIISESVSFEGCVISVPFWFFTLIGCLTSSFYVNDLLKEN